MPPLISSLASTEVLGWEAILNTITMREDVAKSSVMIAHVTRTSLGMLFKLDGPR